jgi:hypothetical protein
MLNRQKILDDIEDVSWNEAYRQLQLQYTSELHDLHIMADGRIKEIIAGILNEREN